MHVKHRVVELESLEDLAARGASLERVVVQGVDLRDAGVDWARAAVRGAVFLGCRFASDDVELELRRRGALVFPRLEGLPYDPYRSALYTPAELTAGYAGRLEDTLDHRIYRHFVDRGRHDTDILEALAQRIHDHAVEDALKDLLPGKKVVAIMGGHGKRRDDPIYRSVVELARRLARRGYFVASGGGPGVMEAANLGAHLSLHEDPSVVDRAVELLSRSPRFEEGGVFCSGYVDAAREVLALYPAGAENLAVPTWFYGHEPTNLFASHIAKFFSNSLREDGLLALAIHGVVYAPGSAGTTQEIFMDAAQNHYGTFGWVSPMVFLGRARYEDETGIFELVKKLASGRPYGERMMLSDDPAEIVDFLEANPPISTTAG